MKVVVFASDAKGLSSLNSIILEAVNKDLELFVVVTNSTTLKYPRFNKDAFDIFTNVDYNEGIESVSLGMKLPFVPDWLFVARERWNPEESIILEFKSKFKCKVGLIEPNSWILGGVEAKLETESRNRFKDLIDVFFVHSNHSKKIQEGLGFKGNMVVVGNPKYDTNTAPNKETLQQVAEYYKVDSKKEQVLLFSLINSNRANLNKYFREYIKNNPDKQFFYKPYPGEPFDTKFSLDYSPNFFLENCTPILEENHIWSMFNICNIHIGCVSSIVHASLLLGKHYIDLSKYINIEEQYLNVDNILKKDGVGIENNVGMWLRTFNLSSPNQLTQILNEDLLNTVKENNKIVWNNLDNSKNLLILFDEYNDKQAAKRILNYILDENI